LARTVLLADDSVTAQNMGRRILMDAGYEVITVNNGSAALKKIHESKPDLIVLDVYMPGYGGLEVCQRLKETAETMKIPVLLTVGKMEPFKADEAKRVRADAHIVKPFDASELLAALTRLEDRIVPSADGRGNGKSKKARIWHSEDPAKNFDDSNTDQITYLAEVKQRQAKSEPVEETAIARHARGEEPQVAPASITPQESTAKVVAPEQESPAREEAATLATAPESPSTITESAPEFLVEKESPLEFQAEAAPGVEPSLPLEATGADAVSTTVAEAVPATETKSRWVAENVALTAEEASLELEREMHTAQAATPVAEGSVEDERAAATQELAVTDASSSPESAGEQFSAASEPAAPSDPVASAFAAAASAGVPGMPEVPSINAVSTPEPPVASEAAAAWENWQHIRDSVMTPQNTAALAASVAEIAQTAAPDQTNEPAQPFPEPSSSSEAGATPLSEGQGGSFDLSGPSVEPTTDSSIEGEALASIVDSVLAELKPKLMQEIARKLKK
jgi:CheY-like chemotaxis protein